MSTENPLASLPESAMWTDAPELAAALDRLIDDDKLGLFVAAPARVAIPTTRFAPLVGCRVETLRDACKNPSFSDSAVVVASSLRSGVVRANVAFELPTYVLDMPDGPEGDPGPGITGGTFRIDLVRRLGLPHGPASYAAWVLVRDRISNVARFETSDPPPAYDDPEVAKFIDEWRSSHLPPLSAVSPPRVYGQRLPSYGSVPSAPKMPSQKGIALSVPRVTLLEPNAPCELKAAFRVPVLRRQIVKDPTSTDGATAIVPITLVITGGDWAGPVVATLRVPSFTPIDPTDPAPIVEGQLAIDLLGLPDMWRVPRTNFVWAFNGDLVSEPATVAFVTEAMLAEAERPV